MTTLPIRTALGLYEQAEVFQSGYVTPGCTCTDGQDNLVNGAVVTSITGPVEIEDVDGTGWFRTALITLPWSAGSSLPYTDTGVFLFGVEWSTAMGAPTAAAVGNDMIQPGYQYIGTASGANPISLTTSDDYELRLWLDLSYTGYGNCALELIINGTVEDSWGFYGLGGVGSTFGRPFESLAPPCYATAASGTPISTTTQFSLSIASTGDPDIFDITIDDPNQSGYLSDPGGAPNNFDGAAGQCQVGGAACWVQPQPYAQAPQSLEVQVVADSTTHKLTTYAPWSTVLSAGASGSGATVTSQIDLRPFNIPAWGLSGASAAAVTFRQQCDAWIAAYGDGTPVPVVAASADAVECLAVEYPGFPRTAPVGYGVTVLPVGGSGPDHPGAQSHVTGFDCHCTPSSSVPVYEPAIVIKAVTFA